MKWLYIGIAFVLSPLYTPAQCLTDFSKLIPEPSVDAASGFGNAVSLFDNYLAVGVPYNDSLGRITGLVYIYELINSRWEKVATMTPSDPTDGIRFGITVKLMQNYLLVGAHSSGGKVYIFKKDVTGWNSQTEISTLSYPATSYFGIHSNRSLSVSDDQQTIAIADPYYHNASMPLSRSGAIFIYHKGAHADWSNAITPTVLVSPEDDCHDFGISGASMLGNRLATVTPYSPSGKGRVYVYHDLFQGFFTTVLEAKLDPGEPDDFDSYLFGATSLAFTTEGIFITAITNMLTSGKFSIIFFPMPASGNWSNSTTIGCYIEPKSDGTIDNRNPLSISSNGSELFATVRGTNGNGYLNIIRKSADGWCSPTYELIDHALPPPEPLSNNYGLVYDVSQTATTAVVGFVSHPENPNSMTALKVFSKNGASWESQPLYSSKKSTSGHLYGRKILGFDNFLFVAAPYDGTVKTRAGAVYSYKKVGGTWHNTGKILPPLGESIYDDVFGTALASNRTHLAIGASGHEPKGKVFVYKKNGSDWGSVELVQEVVIPEEGLTVYAYGDNLAMDDNWLVIPYVQNSPARIILAIFKFNGITWDFKQIVEVGNASFSAKESTAEVAIDNGIIVTRGMIVELNEDDEWQVMHYLSPSDPEPMQISSDFSYWITNGSMFGHSVAVHDNTIFIGAPGRDYEGVWDVGAVYVYTKEPNEPWSSRTETIKLVPRIKEENELFGFSVSALFNTLIVGAPGNDFNRNNTPRNKPGRAYVFQAEDYLWENVTALIDFTGDSFEKDYYGISVYVDNTDFFMGASIEDLESGKLSGSVYITPAPPIVKLVPPVCLSNDLVDLLGYPFGGVWSGPGLIDENEGIFDPIAAGLGVKTFTYITESCAYPGKLQIRIEPPVQAILLVENNQVVCANSSFNKVLSVLPQSGASYQWYYRATDSQLFVAIGENTPTIQVSLRGNYKVRVSNKVCQAYSPIISIHDQLIDLQLQPIGPTCNNLTTGITLSATPAGGNWNGVGVTNNTFNPVNLFATEYPLTYVYTSAEGCIFQKSIMAEVRQAFNPVIQRLSGDLCKDGNVVVGLNGTVPPDMQVTWYRWSTQTNNYIMMHQGSQTMMLVEKGKYVAKVGNQVCESFSEPYELKGVLQAVMSPNEYSAEICNDEVYTLSIEPQPDAVYEWYFYKEQGETPVRLNEFKPTLTIDQTGYYLAVIIRGLCTYESEPRYIYVYPDDNIFVPTIFTPNGDKDNEVFKIVSHQNIETFDIYNRQGNKVFSGSGTNQWDGGNSESGVYYWMVTYYNCRNQKVLAKGWVHLVR
ncbi:MAG: gliding motility-associated C-terminal domain-containing protein [Cyclobacteriaceae bacterium]|nr:gliding motility-associated C-terminal domain-containing protein [Cyclobacteriaceae bacterium]